MDSADSPSKPDTFAHGSIFPRGANSGLESDSCKPSRVVVWCVKRAKFLKPCTGDPFNPRECACIPMEQYLKGGQMDRIHQ